MSQKDTSDNTHSINKSNHNLKSLLSSTTIDDSLKVAIRIRPPLPREIEPNLPFRSIAIVSKTSPTISLVEYIGCEFLESEKQKEWIEKPQYFQYHKFTFDFIYDMDTNQENVYLTCVYPAVNSILEGYNSTILAYGQTGTGKTYTMEGFDFDYLNENRGMIPRTIDDIFTFIEKNSDSNTTFIIRSTYLQIYNEQISDLLKPEKKNLSIREDKKKGLYVESLSEWAVRSPKDVYTLLERGENNRAKANTHMNDVSSRSHAVFSIQVEQMSNINGEQSIKIGKLNLVDLAGSERIKISGATGKQLEESKKINKSLSALGNVIYALTDPKKNKHIPYRDSKLTRLLENSLGGNCKTTMIAMISPAENSFNESYSTLNFAKRAKSIKNKAVVNEDIDHNALIRQYESELKKLKKELEEKDNMLKNNNFLIELQEQKKEAERDKNEAIQALEEASIKYLQERDEKKKLESKIELMNFQLIPGGTKINIEDTPQFQTLLKKNIILLEKDFNEKLSEIEQERKEIQASKEQVDSYNKLILKQNEIMSGLKNKVNESNEAIAQLQEEIEAYESMNKNQENIIENKEKRIKLLENLLSKNNIKFEKEERVTINLFDDDDDNNNNKTFKKKIYTKNEKWNNINVMLTSDEKISELNKIIEEKDKEISFLKKISEKINKNFQDEKNAEIINEINNLKFKYNNNSNISKDLDNLLNKLDSENKNNNKKNNKNYIGSPKLESNKISIDLSNNHLLLSPKGNSIKGIKIQPFKKK